MGGFITIKGTTVDLRSVREIKFTKNVGRFVILSLTSTSGQSQEFVDLDNGSANEVWDAWIKLNIE